MAELAPGSDPPRPSPSRPPADRARDLVAGAVDRLRWFGVARACGVALCVVAAGIGSFWLVRTPSLPIEASLPFATVPGDSPHGTGTEGRTATTVAGTSGPAVPGSARRSSRRCAGW